ncbi:calmodulin-A-like [Mya arenaria]|uniref:calmodulin-A-like n=1 Tax=Mya arenaria TaxID=6604 RepID=UPI0022E522D5|nr:calmodulin-A-like [Mya arenaria]
MDNFMWITNSKKLKEFRLRFNVYDQNQTGVVKVIDLQTILREMGMDVAMETLQQMMKNIDLYGREDVHFDEFLLMAAKLEACEDDEQELKEAFSVFDNGKGMVSVPDLRAIMANMGEKLSKEEVEEMIDEATVNRNNMIKINDFISVLLR